jgi:hypothetical protein
MGECRSDAGLDVARVLEPDPADADSFGHGREIRILGTWWMEPVHAEEDTYKKWSQGQLERERLGVEGEGQYVHVQDVLAETSDVLAHVGAEARHQTGCANRLRHLSGGNM